jgi:hypothetical protein
MSIINDSPQLAFTLLRRFSRDNIALLEQAFDVASQSGGAKELDFERKPDMPYNPRLARVTLILINDAKVTDYTLLAAAMLAAALEANSALGHLDEAFPADIVHLAKLSQCSPQELRASHDPHWRKAALISLALRLDRARHIHLATDEIVRQSWKSFLEITDDYIDLAASVSVPLHSLFSTWKRRFQLKVEILSKGEEQPPLPASGEFPGESQVRGLNCRHS